MRFTEEFQQKSARKVAGN